MIEKKKHVHEGSVLVFDCKLEALPNDQLAI